MKLAHHGNFEQPAPPIIAVHILEHLVQPLSEERLEAVDWPIVSDLSRYVNRPVMIRLHFICTVHLEKVRCQRWVDVLKHTAE